MLTSSRLALLVVAPLVLVTSAAHAEEPADPPPNEAAPPDTATPPRPWDHPVRGELRPSVAFWASTSTLVNAGLASTIWTRGPSALFVGLSAGVTGPHSPGHYSITMSELGIKIGTPRIHGALGWGFTFGNDARAEHGQMGMSMKALLAWQPLHHFGVFGGVGLFRPFESQASNDDSRIDGILGIQL
jgi:hypothetical protein